MSCCTSAAAAAAKQALSGCRGGGEEEVGQSIRLERGKRYIGQERQCLELDDL